MSGSTLVGKKPPVDKKRGGRTKRKPRASARVPEKQGGRKVHNGKANHVVFAGKTARVVRK